MDIYKELRKQSIAPSLKKNGFKKAGKIFSRELESGVVYIIEVNVFPIVENDFSVSINYGIYFKGVTELLFGFPFEIKRGVASCVYRSYMRDKKFQCHWNSNKFTSAEVFYDEVSASIENNIILFLNNVTTGEKLLELFQSDINFYIKNDGTLALQIACLNFLLRNKEKGKEIVKMVIAASKVKYEFAENLLRRMED